MPRKKLDLLDATGRKILGHLVKNARMPLKEIGERVSLSVPAVAERVQRMEEEGLIKGYEAKLDYDKIGCPVHILVEIHGAKDRSLINDVQARVPEVIQYWVVTGEMDYLVELAVCSRKRLEEVLRVLERIGLPKTHRVLDKEVPQLPPVGVVHAGTETE